MKSNQNEAAPPKWMDRVLECFCAPHLLEEVKGDLHERFHLRAKRIGASKARKYYLREVFSFARPYIMRRNVSNNTLKIAMFKNYFKIAYRNLINKKVYSGINIVGLSIGITCCMLIFQYVAFEKSFDSFHEHETDIYRVLPGFGRGDEKVEFKGAYTPQSMAPAFKEAVPEILHITRVHTDNVIVSDAAHPDKVFEEDEVLYADPDFLKMFTFPLKSGNIRQALLPGTALLSEAAALKYFGEDNPVGKTMAVTGQVQQDYRVVGVFSGVPDNSHLQFEILLSMDNLLKGQGYANEPEGGWSWNNFGTYIQLHPDANRELTEQKLTKVLLEHRGEALQHQGYRSGIKVQPLKDIHLNAEITGALNEAMGSSRTVYFFTIIGLVTFLIALINYINLSTARALNRAREVGVRKVIGAQKTQLVVQFLCDAALTNFIALVLALAATAWLIPYVNNIADTHLSTALWLHPDFWLVFLVTLLVSTLLSGLYPAFILSSFKPVTVLKGRLSSFSSQQWLRKGLVVLQFAASIVLITGTVIIYNQLDYMRGRDLGLDIEKVLTIEGPRNLQEGIDRANATASFLNELRKIPGIEQAASSHSLPGQRFNWNGASIRKATDDPANALRGVATYVDTSFAKLYGLELLAGKGFEDITISTAEDAPWPVIINENLVKSLDFEGPSTAINEMLDIGGYEAQVIGVYKDFNWTSAHQEQQNVVLGPSSTGRHLSLKVSTSDLPATVDKIESLYNQFFPANVFNYGFVDQIFDRQYRNDIRFAKLFGLFAGLAIFIACLGLFGLASFTSQQRKKEIGVRKVLGASVGSVVKLLNIDFIKLVIIGFVVAVPVAWYIMDQWLADFAYRIEIGTGVFLLAGLAALFIAILTVSGLSIKAAISNPVDSLREE
ncbi:ABC transporter permease [Fulvivirga imtechensis]|nr:ABC transporter permease [Fulvivirga imtechensis]